MTIKVIDKGASLSVDRCYRYALWRGWDENWRENFMLVVGLNPSTADENEDDPTIRRCVGFAQRMGYDGVVMANLFAYRATLPADMMVASNPVGANDAELLDLAPLAGVIVCAWGTHGSFKNRDKEVARLLSDYRLKCFGTTKAGHPKHPLYLPKTTQLEAFRL